MVKTFNVNGACRPARHYMVNLTSRLAQIKKMVDNGEYFAMNRARQYGKTTTLRALAEYLRTDYEVVSLDFQRLGTLSFESEQTFVAAFSEELLHYVKCFPEGVEGKLTAFVEGTARINSLQALFKCMELWCGRSEKPVVLIIDEVDTASNNQVFLDFLAQLRAAYLDSDVTPTFRSVILAGVYDVRSMKNKIRPDGEHKENSPWNTRVGNEENESLLAFDDCPRDHREFTPYDIAADFDVDMSFSAEDIAGMLAQYEDDYRTGMDIQEISGLIYEYTSGYPFLVSRLCKLMDEKLAGTEVFPDKKTAWTRDGFLTALKTLLEENNPLFDSLTNKLSQFPELRTLIANLFFQGQSIAYNADNNAIRNARMFGFVKANNSTVQIANRVFEIRLYNNLLLDYMEQNSNIYAEGARWKKSVYC